MTEPATRHVRFLTNPKGEAVFVLVVDDQTNYFSADVYELTYINSVDEVASAFTGEDAEWTWLGDAGADAYGSFFVKWDTCSHVAFGHEWKDRGRPSVDLHMCGRDAWVRHLALMEHVYNRALSHVPFPEGWKDDKHMQETRQPLRSQWSETLVLDETVVPFPQKPSDG